MPDSKEQPKKKYRCAVNGHEFTEPEPIVGVTEIGGKKLHCPICFGMWLRNHVSLVREVE